MIIPRINGSDTLFRMDGPKRLQFTTVGQVESKPKKDESVKTYRFDLKLPDSTDTTCPEFFYTELLKTVPVS